MPKIHILDKHTAELIAAGEVVERPASAVKELLENSIDAGADAVTVEIKNGGNTFIRVTDNGSGIERADIRNAFLRHATSKIQTPADLDAIATLGFRGEALASIAAVAKVEVLTRTADCELGTKYEIQGGQDQEPEDAGCAVGTTIVIRDLFFNTPARQKFLKKDQTEANAVAGVVDRIALSHPEVSIKLIRDGRQTMLTPGDGQLQSAIYAVLGKDFAGSLLPCDYTMDGVRVSGFVTRPDAARPNANMQFFFLNGRYIKTKTGAAALKQAYKNEILAGKQPGCVLNLRIAPEQVDVNVHPAKIEVRFSDETRIFHAVYYAAKSAITADQTVVQFQSGTAERPAEETVSAASKQMDIRDYLPKTREQHTASEEPVYTPALDIEKDEQPVIRMSESAPAYGTVLKLPDLEEILPTKKEPEPAGHVHDTLMTEPASQQTALSVPDFRYVGQAFGTYILLEIRDKLVLIDKHAAHERILFEQLRQTAHSAPQMLLSPVIVQLGAEEYDALLSKTEELGAFGFEIEDYGGKAVIVRSVPMELDAEDVRQLIYEIAGKISDQYTDFSPEFSDWLYHSVACRAAVKAGDGSSAYELTKLAEQVLTDPRIRRCPHGRPVLAELSKDEIKRRFSRI